MHTMAWWIFLTKWEYALQAGSCAHKGELEFLSTLRQLPNAAQSRFEGTFLVSKLMTTSSEVAAYKIIHDYLIPMKIKLNKVILPKWRTDQSTNWCTLLRQSKLDFSLNQFSLLKALREIHRMQNVKLWNIADLTLCAMHLPRDDWLIGVPIMDLR